MSCYKLIDAEKASYPVSMLCRVLRVSRSGYYDWKVRLPSKRAKENEILIEKIREIHARSRGEPTAIPGSTPSSRLWECVALGGVLPV